MGKMYETERNHLVDELKKNICPRKEKSDNLDSMELKDKEEE